MGFKEAGAKPMPRLACIGRVSGVLPGKISQKGVYIVQKLIITGYGPSRDTKPMVLYRPDWFMEGFDPESLNELEGGDKMLAVYRNHISERGRTSTIKGLCGNDTEKFYELSDRLFALKLEDLDLSDSNNVKDMLENVTNVFQTFLVDEGNGDPVGYVLGQQTSKTDEVDPKTGKAIYIAEGYYEVKEFFDPTDQNKIASLRKAAGKSDGKFKIAFDETPF